MLGESSFSRDFGNLGTFLPKRIYSKNFRNFWDCLRSNATLCNTHLPLCSHSVKQLLTTTSDRSVPTQEVETVVLRECRPWFRSMWDHASASNHASSDDYPLHKAEAKGCLKLVSERGAGCKGDKCACSFAGPPMFSLLAPSPRHTERMSPQPKRSLAKNETQRVSSSSFLR